MEREQTAASDQELPFEQLMETLSQLVTQLEQGELPLDEALRIYERGVQLSIRGDHLLKGVEHRVIELREALTAATQPK